MNSKIILVKGINMDKEYINVLNYTEQQMLSLCRSQNHLVAEANDYSFLRTTNSIMAGFTYSQCLQSNYIAFQNPDYSNKWFFAWIDDVIYKGDRNTEITFTIDAWSTWFDKWQVKKCFVNRHHVNDDTRFKNLIEENISVGDYIMAENETRILDDIDDFYICMAVTELPDESLPLYAESRVYNGIYGGLYYLAFPTAEDCNKAIKMYDFKSKADAISYLFMVPKDMSSITSGTIAQWTIGTIGTSNVIYIKSTTNADNVTNLIGEIPNHVGKNYIPKNNKLFSYPFNYCIVSNNNGISEEFKYEDFEYDDLSPNEFGFWFSASLTPGMSMLLIPTGYKNRTLNYNSAIPGGKLPICSWNSDVYVNWLTQNAVSIGLSTFAPILGLVANPKNFLKTKNLISTSLSTAETLNSIVQADRVPNQARGNTNNGDVNFSEGHSGFVIYYMTIRDDYAKIIDDYFSRFGYAIKSLEIPNITGRQYWNYIEIGQNEDIGYGEVPNKYMEIINNACRKGVTIWHNHSNVGNYNLNNSII